MRRLAHESQSSYIRSVRRAERTTDEEGIPLITYLREDLRRTLGSQQDAYCHIDTPESFCGGIAQTNSRELSDQAQHVLQELFLESRHRTRMLFLGAGCGLECAQARNILPDVHIETRAFSPIDPFHSPLLPYHELKAQADMLARDRSWRRSSDDDALADELANVREVYPPSLLMDVDARLPQPVFFQETENPLVDRQTIGPFTKDSTVDEKDVIYDSCGPLQKMNKYDFYESVRRLQFRFRPGAAIIIDCVPEICGKDLQDCHDLRENLVRGNGAAVHPGFKTVLIAGMQQVRRLRKDWSKRFGTDWQFVG